ncbi:MAG: diacylglycerol kinase [Hydrogenophilales bacterium CG03_land_8_20_14_0_80_62_28]|nr:dihydrofolate reductase [Betaproteobacteria bacterium]OIO77520.1 MAG: diacylglycerol kinase [Hydrogenophilaceae bacterium CG1_02_62_390]PIV22917.1 MAG: diacylglycerol kinase [Hydrogenophilales bacterium CG03_land_8_20_14_0_80_62_28]PIW38031.1 MAG: diacylglycerol kinase [Hydrogenophilales bacterium CG15_BIG_FIL_POST_REV_8_21_14_020_62_31]PIW70842.1 MAG: diacylglycerol kinase [Hydrogenophilales bacterium CG12_big_fil_rev_8_21_14_0_65_61_21]PIX00542.1 MAG: diacylglycerol kinase [Hydrogenophila
MKPRLSLIVAMARNRVIGIDNTLPWHLPEDLKHFKALTMGHHLIMGRKTYESIGRPLPGRTTVIVSRDPTYRAAGCLTAGSVAEAIALCQGDDEIFFVGGASLYGQALPFAQRLYLTEIQQDYAGDAYFPAFVRADWREASRTHHVSEGGLGYDFVVYERQ